MDKVIRYLVIQEIVKKIGKPLSALKQIKSMKRETDEEIGQVLFRNDDNSIVDAETNLTLISTNLANILKPSGKRIHINETDFLLTREEKAQVANDLAEHKKKYWLALPMQPLEKLLRIA